TGKAFVGCSEGKGGAVLSHRDGGLFWYACGGTAQAVPYRWCHWNFQVMRGLFPVALVDDRALGWVNHACVDNLDFIDAQADGVLCQCLKLFAQTFARLA